MDGNLQRGSVVANSTQFIKLTELTTIAIDEAYHNLRHVFRHVIVEVVLVRDL